MASEFLVSKMENFRKFVFTHPLMSMLIEEMSLMQRAKLMTLQSMKLTSVSIMDVYKEFLVEHEKEKENSPLHLTKDEGWIVWSFPGHLSQLMEKAAKLAAIRPEKTEEEWETILINDQKKLVGYLNLVHQFYLKINSAQ